LPEIIVKPDATFKEWLQSITSPFMGRERTYLIQVPLMAFVACLTITVLESQGTESFGIALLTAACFLIYLLLCQRLTTLRRQAIFLAQKGAATSYAFSNEGLEAKDATSVKKYSWEALSRCVETSGTYMLVFRTFDIVCIPKRDIPSEGAVEFAVLLETKLGAGLRSPANAGRIP